MANILLEVCVDGIGGLEAAWLGGADRIELCSALAVGGLTPSAGLMMRAAQLPIPVYAMIRPRSGDFVYSPGEVEVMLGDIAAARAAGLAGVVLGASCEDGSLDTAALERLSAHAHGLGLSLHRAFDLVPDVADAVETAVALGFERILSSGGAPTALGGLKTLSHALASAAGRISVMPGSGVTLQTVDALLAEIDVAEVHSSCSRAGRRTSARIHDLGFAGTAERETDTEIVRALKARLTAMQGETQKQVP